jgi:methylenetetrahydrofolate dehydrogenase (NADP+)/methenyltetrahydrofolate cyclohydrolase
MVIYGKGIARKIEEEIRSEICRLDSLPTLLVISVSRKEEIISYFNSIKRIAKKVGISVEENILRENTTTEKIIELLRDSGKRKEISAILVGRPLPKSIDFIRVAEAIPSEKDVDCINPINLGRLLIGKPLFYPCTPEAIFELMKFYNVEIEGKDVVIIGRSNVVGKPLSLMLLDKGIDATVTVCHTKTQDLATYTKGADILISAAGNPRFITKDMIKNGAVVIDIGINVTKDGIIGDVDFDEVKEIASMITPVPGGVGPITTRVLLRNAVKAAKYEGLHSL